MDIYDIMRMVEHTTDADALMVFDSLLCGSHNHMRAFQGQLEKYGEVYEAQFLSAEEIEAIVLGDSEQCGGGGGGGGGGAGSARRPLRQRLRARGVVRSP